MADAKKKILLGVTGSIAAFKAVDLMRMMQRKGWDVWVVMTSCATQYVGPLTFRTLSGNPVVTGTFAEMEQVTYTHLQLAETAAAMVVAPCSAQTIARIAHGFADDILSCTAISITAPLLISPAMNVNMWKNVAVQENVAILKRRGVQFVGPGTGLLACRTEGEGRLCELDEIVAAVEAAVGGS